MFPVLAANRQQSRAWFTSPAARPWRAAEAGLLPSLMAGMTGYRCVWLGPAAAVDCGAGATLRRWHGDIRPEGSANFVYDGAALPLVTGSIDALVLAHALELSREPHRLIRECERVLSERGQLIVLAFNPLAPAAWFNWRRVGAGFLPCSRPPRAARLIDWLRMIDFEVTDGWRYGPGFPLFGGSWHIRDDTRLRAPLAWMAGGYAVIARRRALRRIPPGGWRVPACVGPAVALGCRAQASALS